MLRFFVALMLTAMVLGCSPRASKVQGDILPPDYRNNALPVIQKYERLKKGEVFKNSFEKKAEVCPLCQF